MTSHKFDLTAVKFVQCAVIANQAAFFQINMLPDFRPESISAWKKPMQMPSEGIMGGTSCFIRLNTLRFRAAIDFLSSYQEINVIAICYLSFVHAAILADFHQLRNSYQTLLPIFLDKAPDAAYAARANSERLAVR